MTRGDAELAALAAQLTHMPRSQWPADVFEYQQRVQREKKRASRAALEEEDRLRREAEQARRREQLGKDGDSDDEPQQREASRRRSRTKRARDNDDYASMTIPGDLMSEDELAAARVASLAAPGDDTQRRIVEHVRVASDARQGERVCVVCEHRAQVRVGDRARVRAADRDDAASMLACTCATTAATGSCSSVHAQLAGILLSPTAFAVARVELGANADVSTLACVCGKVCVQMSRDINAPDNQLVGLACFIATGKRPLHLT